MKRTTLPGLDARSIAAIGPDALTLAESEGLDAHARSIAFRLNQQRLTVDYRLAAIILDEASVVHRSRAIEQEREVAIYDLLEKTASGRKGRRAWSLSANLGWRKAAW